MMRRTTFAAAAALCALALFAGDGFRWRLDPINELSRPDIAGAANLSGIAWVSNDVYWAVTDWNTVLWEMSLPHDPDTGRITGCTMKRLCSPMGAGDVEGIIRDPFDGSIWLADEKFCTIKRYDPVSGKVLPGDVDIPESLKRFRNDLGLESLTVSEDGLSMWTCNEESVETDGPRSARGRGCDVRLTRLCRTGAGAPWKPQGQWVYHTDPIVGGPWYNKKRKELSRSGVSELCLLEDGTVLVLEREFSMVLLPRLRCRIYEVDISSAVNVLGRPDLSGIVETDKVKKRMMHEITGFAMYEGMCLGPKLKDGSRMVVLVSDGDMKSLRMVMALRLSRLK